MSRHVILYVYNNSTVSLDSLVYVLGGPRDVGNLPLTSQITWSTMNHLSAGWYFNVYSEHYTTFATFEEVYKFK